MASGMAPAARDPQIEVDARGLLVAKFHSRAVVQLRFFQGAAQVPHAIKRGGNLVARDMTLPIVAGALEKSNRLAALFDALRESRSGVHHHAVVVQRLPLAGKVAKATADIERLLRIVAGPTQVTDQCQTGSMLGICLGQLGSGEIALGQVHVTQVRPHDVRQAAAVPTSVSQVREQLQRQPFGLVGQSLLAMHEEPRQAGVQNLHDTFEHDLRNEHRPASRHEPAEFAQGRLERLDGSFHVSPLERQLAELVADLGLGKVPFGDGGRGRQLPARLFVPSTQHQDAAQFLGNAIADAGRGGFRATRGNTVLLFRDFQGVLGAGLGGRLQRIGQCRARIPGFIEVVGRFPRSARYGAVANRWAARPCSTRRSVTACVSSNVERILS